MDLRGIYWTLFICIGYLLFWLIVIIKGNKDKDQFIPMEAGVLAILVGIGFICGSYFNLPSLLFFCIPLAGAFGIGALGLTFVFVCAYMMMLIINFFEH